MNFTQLRAFYAVASEGGFTRGAERLGISQPAVTVQVKALEQAYGIELFHRRGQGVELTEFGHELWLRSRRVFAELDDLEGLLVSAGALQVGQLDVGADGPFVVMDLLAAFIQRYPGVRVAVRMGNATRVLADLEEGRTDLAILNLVRPSSGLHSQALHHDRIVAFVPKSHGWAKRRRLSLVELAGAPLVLREPGSATRALLLDAFAAAELTPRVALEFGSREAVHEAVLAGLGVGAVFASELVPHTGLHTLSIHGAELGADVSLACLTERKELRVVRAFSRVAEEVMARRRA